LESVQQDTISKHGNLDRCDSGTREMQGRTEGTGTIPTNAT
jgi:hypothetical protein